MEHVITTKYGKHTNVYTYKATKEKAEEYLETAKANIQESINAWTKHVANGCDFQHYLKQDTARLASIDIMTYEQFTTIEREERLNSIHKISEQEYWDGIEQLPPHKTVSINGIYFYDCLEADTGSYRTSWIETGDDFYATTVSDFEKDDERYIRIVKLIKGIK